MFPSVHPSPSFPGEPSTPLSSKPWLTHAFFGVPVRCFRGSILHPPLVALITMVIK